MTEKVQILLSLAARWGLPKESLEPLPDEVRNQTRGSKELGVIAVITRDPDYKKIGEQLKDYNNHLPQDMGDLVNRSTILVLSFGLPFPGHLYCDEKSFGALRYYGYLSTRDPAAPDTWQVHPYVDWAVYEKVEGEFAPHWSEDLPTSACYGAALWCATQPDPQTAWNNCEHASWMEWLIDELNVEPSRHEIHERAAELARGEGLRAYSFYDLPDELQTKFIRRIMPTHPQLK